MYNLISFNNGLACVSYEFYTVVSHEPDPFYEPESHLINKKGEKIFGQEFDSAFPFSGGLAPAENRQDNTNQGKFGFIDKTGNWKIKPEYKLAHSFSDGYALVADYDNKCGYVYYYINRNGVNVFQRTFKTAARFYKKYAFVTYQDPDTDE